MELSTFDTFAVCLGIFGLILAPTVLIVLGLIKHKTNQITPKRQQSVRPYLTYFYCVKIGYDYA